MAGCGRLNAPFSQRVPIKSRCRALGVNGDLQPCREGRGQQVWPEMVAVPIFPLPSAARPPQPRDIIFGAAPSHLILQTQLCFIIFEKEKANGGTG